MSKAWSARSTAERKEVEAAFIARHGAELLLEGDAEPSLEADRQMPPAGRRLPFAHLHSALTGGGPLPSEVSRALRTDPELREDFALLLERFARQHLPRAAAAADRGGLRRREAEGFVLRLVASRADRDQIYLLVELPEETFAGAASPPAPTPEHAASPAPSPQVGLNNASPATRPGGSPVAGSAEAAPGRIVVRTAGGEFLKRVLPSPEARTIRLLMATDDPLVRAVAEPSSEIFLL